MIKWKFVGLIYIGITVLSFLCVVCTTTSFVDVVPGLVYMWLCFVLFYLAYQKGGRPAHTENQIPISSSNGESVPAIVCPRFGFKHV